MPNNLLFSSDRITNLVNKGNTVEIIYFGVSRAFDTDQHNILEVNQGNVG